HDRGVRLAGLRVARDGVRGLAVRAEFLRPAGDGSELVAAAKWTGSAVEFEPRGDDGRGILERIFRPASVAVDDPALRSFGTSGEVTLQPGSARWFMAAARTRG